MLLMSPFIGIIDIPTSALFCFNENIMTVVLRDIHLKSVHCSAVTCYIIFICLSIRYCENL